MTNPLIDQEWTVHKEGFIRVVDIMGDDEAVVQMARTSYGKGTKTVNEDRGLIRYLMRHAHTSPFEGAVIKLHIKMPIFVARQWIRHRTASLNEYSARYSEVKDSFFIPQMGEVMGQSKTNKQGSQGALSNEDQQDFIDETELTAKEAYTEYQHQLEKGVSREMARINLPLSCYTEMYWQMNLHNLLHFCKLRSHPHAQKEIRAYSDIILHEIIKEWVPHTYEAFIDYVMEAAHFSNKEMDLVRKMFDQLSADDKLALLHPSNFGSGRELEEFQRKLIKE